MPSVGIHPPKTPVTKGSMGIAKATLPNVCKMPGPPAPFVPSPLPNIAKSGSSPKDYSTSVKIEGKTVAIRGAMFESMGDIASKGTGGGLISANTHGPAKFITPGSMTVKIEGKSVHLLGEPMLNNCGPSGSPPNTGATMVGLDQAEQKKWDDKLQKYINECDKEEDDKYGPAAKDCDKPCVPAESMDNGEPKLIRVKLGELKENCVYKKMGFTEKNKDTGKYETATKTAPNGNSVTIQQRFSSAGVAGSGGVGSIVPDILYKGADGEIACIRDLKFRCPKGWKMPDRDKNQMNRYTTILKKAAEVMQPK